MPVDEVRTIGLHVRAICRGYRPVHLSLQVSTRKYLKRLCIVRQLTLLFGEAQCPS
jgi:hypothetical protein